MSRGRKKQNRMAKFSITCMVCLLIALMSTQIVKLYHKNQELAVKEATYEEQKRAEEARQQQLQEQEKSDQNSPAFFNEHSFRYIHGCN